MANQNKIVKVFPVADCQHEKVVAGICVQCEQPVIEWLFVPTENSLIFAQMMEIQKNMLRHMWSGNKED